MLFESPFFEELAITNDCDNSNFIIFLSLFIFLREKVSIYILVHSLDTHNGWDWD